MKRNHVEHVTRTSRQHPSVPCYRLPKRHPGFATAATALGEVIRPGFAQVMGEQTCPSIYAGPHDPIASHVTSPGGPVTSLDAITHPHDEEQTTIWLADTRSHEAITVLDLRQTRRPPPVAPTLDEWLTRQEEPQLPLRRIPAPFALISAGLLGALLATIWAGSSPTPNEATVTRAPIAYVSTEPQAVPTSQPATDEQESAPQLETRVVNEAVSQPRERPRARTPRAQRPPRRRARTRSPVSPRSASSDPSSTPTPAETEPDVIPSSQALDVAGPILLPDF